MRARIDLSEVEERTKIRAKYLRAIENEDWDLLPGPVYVKSFLRTYGDLLGLDSRLLIDEFRRRYEGPAELEPRPVAVPRERQRIPRGSVLPPWAIIGVVLVAVVVALYFLGTLGNKSSPPAGVRAGSGQPRARRVHRAGTATTPVVRRPRVVKLHLVPTGPVYVCLVDGAGTKLIPGQIFSPGQTIRTATAGKLLLTLGNNSVQMKVDGSLVKVAPSTTSIGFLLSPSGNRPLPPARQPTCK